MNIQNIDFDIISCFSILHIKKQRPLVGVAFESHQ